jgi:hypothetical protein
MEMRDVLFYNSLLGLVTCRKEKILAAPSREVAGRGSTNLAMEHTSVLLFPITFLSVNKFAH